MAVAGERGAPIANGAFLARTSRTRGFTSSPRRVAEGVTDLPAISVEKLVPADGISVAKSGLSPDLQWITDPWDRGVLFSVKVERILHDVRSKFQRIQVLETPAMGRMLVLDSALQCAERDEAGYHEFMTHVALCRKGAAAGGGKRALVIGGGDGGAARELLRHDDVAVVDLVDIDSEVTSSTSAGFGFGDVEHTDEGRRCTLSTSLATAPSQAILTSSPPSTCVLPVFPKHRLWQRRRNSSLASGGTQPRRKTSTCR